jgi:hypothetical protein
MEWAYRLLQEPRRLTKRYLLGNPFFLAAAVLWRLSQRLHPDEFIARRKLVSRPNSIIAKNAVSNILPWHQMPDRNAKQRFAKALTNTRKLKKT